jgi:hypothetical protein
MAVKAEDAVSNNNHAADEVQTTSKTGRPVRQRKPNAT